MNERTIFCDPLAGAPLPERKFHWFYGAYEYEAFRLAELIRNKERAKLKVCFPGVFHTPSARMSFQAPLPCGTFRFRGCGKLTLRVEDRVVLCEAASGQRHEIELDAPAVVTVELVVEDLTSDIPALYVETPGDCRWTCHCERIVREATSVAALAATVPPHRESIPRTTLVPRFVGDGLWDAGAEMLAFVCVASRMRPTLFVGESRPEALNENPAYFEQNTALVRDRETDVFRTEEPVALRYLRLTGADEDVRVELEALNYPVVYRGYFECDDDFWNDVWAKSAYTLHLCMHHFLIDGIKRDRLPWGGDLIVSLLGDAVIFADAGIARNSLSVLASAGIDQGDINGIVDYTLQLFINHDLYCRYFGDRTLLKREYPRLLEMLNVLFLRCDERGMLTKHCARIYIDWFPVEKETALQMLWVQALTAAEALAERMHDTTTAIACAAHRMKLMAVLEAETFDAATGFYQSSPGGEVDRIYPQAAAILSGMATGERARRLARAMAAGHFPRVGTPYAAFFCILAIARAGLAREALEYARPLWQNMLDLGASSCFEICGREFADSGDYEYYRRPFGQSLCHAWGAGPAFFLPLIACGLEPVTDGWQTFRVASHSELDGTVRVPTPYGEITVQSRNGAMNITAPKECQRELACC